MENGIIAAFFSKVNQEFLIISASPLSNLDYFPTEHNADWNCIEITLHERIKLGENIVQYINFLFISGTSGIAENSSIKISPNEQKRISRKIDKDG